jgi:hypothetical protein
MGQAGAAPTPDDSESESESESDSESESPGGLPKKRGATVSRLRPPGTPTLSRDRPG